MSTSCDFGYHVIFRLTFTGIELRLIVTMLRGEKDVQQLSPGKLTSNATSATTSRKNPTQLVTIRETGNIHLH